MCILGKSVGFPVVVVVVVFVVVVAANRATFVVGSLGSVQAFARPR